MFLNLMNFVVVQLDAKRITVLPHKTDPPAFRNTNSVLTIAVASQTFDPVFAREPQVANLRGMVDPIQSVLCSTEGVGRK